MVEESKRATRFGPKPIGLARRFWAKVDKLGEFDCWLWTGRRAKRYGYGELYRGPGQTVGKAHRISWELHHGPTDLKVLHTCDNPACVNPAHLFLGTQQDNLRDMRDKGRSGGFESRRKT